MLYYSTLWRKQQSPEPARDKGGGVKKFFGRWAPPSRGEASKKSPAGPGFFDGLWFSMVLRQPALVGGDEIVAQPYDEAGRLPLHRLAHDMIEKFRRVRQAHAGH